MRYLDLILSLGDKFLETIQDVTPIVLLIAFFQIMVIKKPIPHLPKVFLGFIFVIIGLTLFLLGLEKALFPLGTLMAKQLSSLDFVTQGNTLPLHWSSYYWLFFYTALMGFATTIAEPSLIAVAYKAQEVSGGTLKQWTLRLVVALGIAVALTLGAFRIINGHSLFLYILVGYSIVVILTLLADKDIIALAYDSGGVTSSTVTVPIVAALGLGLSSQVPGSNPALDGFGLIAIANVAPIITVLSYSIIIHYLKKKKYKKV